MKTTVNCPKCDGKGYLDGIAYANGVCFECKGAKTLVVDLEKKKANLGDWLIEKADWIMAATAESYKNISYAKLKLIRDFAHTGGKLAEAYPELLTHYKATGEPFFQTAQKIQLDEWTKRAAW